MHAPTRPWFADQPFTLEAEQRQLDELLTKARVLLREADDERRRMATLIERFNREREQRIARDASRA